MNLQERRAREADQLDFAGHELASRWGDDSGIEDGDCQCDECRGVQHLPQWGRAGSARVRRVQRAQREPWKDPVQPLTDRPFERLLRAAA